MLLFHATHAQNRISPDIVGTAVAALRCFPPWWRRCGVFGFSHVRFAVVDQLRLLRFLNFGCWASSTLHRGGAGAVAGVPEPERPTLLLRAAEGCHCLRLLSANDPGTSMNY